jgi:hypothetical protein
MTKRPREEDADEVSSLILKPAVVCESLLEVALGWRDRCNSLYDIDSKMYVSKDHIVLKVGFFDELRCQQVTDLVKIRIAGGYVVQSADCDIGKQLVVVKIARSGYMKPEPRARGVGGLDTNELLRLRVTYELKEGDAVNVYNAVQSVLAEAESPQDLRLVRIAQRPSMYVVYISIKSKLVASGVLSAAAAFAGILDFDNKQLIMSVRKTQSDII